MKCQDSVLDSTKKRYFAEIEYYHHPDFDNPKRVKELLGPMPDLEAFEAERAKIKQIDLSKVKLITRSTYYEPLLTRVQERHLLLKYNLLKKLAVDVQKTFAEDFGNSNRRRFRRHLKRAEEIRNQFALSNLRLVCSVIRNKFPHASDSDINEAYVRVWYVIPKFDINLDVKFSTFAVWSIINNFRGMHRDRLKDMRYITNYDTKESRESKVLHKEYISTHVEDTHDNEERMLLQQAIKRVLSTLEKHDSYRRDALVLRHYYAIGLPYKTLDQMAEEMNITKERVRQLRLRGEGFIKEALIKRKLDRLCI